MNFCNMLKGREVHFGEASVAIDKVKASKGFDGKEKTVSPFIRFWCQLCTKKPFAKLELKMV